MTYFCLINSKSYKLGNLERLSNKNPLILADKIVARESIGEVTKRLNLFSKHVSSTVSSSGTLQKDIFNFRVFICFVSSGETMHCGNSYLLVFVSSSGSPQDANQKYLGGVESVR